MAQRKSKPKREIPIRSAGEEVDQLKTRPSALLFAEVKRLEQENLPSTFNKTLPSTYFEELPSNISQTLPSTETSLPSTKLKRGRPQSKASAAHKENKVPSTQNKVDVLPSTSEILPSTITSEKGDVDVSPFTLKSDAVHESRRSPSTKGDRHNKDLARYDNRIDPLIKKKIDVFCAESGMNQREFAEQSAVHFIEVWTAKLLKNVDGKTAHDDLYKMIKGRTSPSIVNLYRAYNPENKWKFKDDESGQQYNRVDLRIIELGIIETQFNSKFKKINSFSYYENEIKNFESQALGDDMLNFLIQHYRGKWRSATGRVIDLSFLEADS